MKMNEIKNFFYYKNKRELTKEEEDKIFRYNQIMNELDTYKASVVIPMGETVIIISNDGLDIENRQEMGYKIDKPLFLLEPNYIKGEKLLIDSDSVDEISKTIAITSISSYELFNGLDNTNKIHTFEELKQFVLKRVFESDDRWVNQMRWNIDQLEAVFDINLDEDEDREPYGKPIVFVKREGNIRLSVLDSQYRYDGRYKVYKFIPEDAEFNWIDKGNVIWEGKYFAFDLDSYLRDQDSDFIDEIEEMVGKFDGIGITETDFKKMMEEAKQNIIQQETIKEQERMISKALMDKMNTDDFELKGWKFNDDKISNKDFSIGIEGEKVSHYLKTGDMENLDINNIWFRIIKKVMDNYYEKPVNLFSGKYKITVNTKTSDNGNKYWYIDEIRVSKRDINKALEHGTCFNELKDYYDFLKSIKKIPFRARELISEGLFIEIGDVFFKFEVNRKGNHWYLGTKSHKIQIRGGFNNILKIPSHRRGNRFENEWRLFDYFISTLEIKKEVAIQMVEDAKEEYKKALERAKILLEETVENNKEKIERIEVNIKEGYGDYEETKKGFKVKGNLKDYFVTENLKIYEYPSLNYVCVVDRTGNDLSKNDKLVARLYALMNDSLLIDAIYTLKDGRS